MASLTLKNLSDELMEKLRRRAARNRRSLLKEVVFLLEGALQRPVEKPDGEWAGRAAESSPGYQVEALGGGVPSVVGREQQVVAWRELCGKWDGGDLSVEEEIEAILAARTAGREVEL